MNRDEMVQSNLPLVHSLANRFRGRGIDYEDLFGAGCIGLVKAVDNFDQSLGFKFSTYAVPVVLGEIKRLFRDGGAVKVSRSLKELYLKVVREQELFLKKEGREPTAGEIAKVLEVSAELVVESLTAMQPTLSLTTGEDSENKELDLKSPSVEEEIAEKLSLKEVVEHLEAADKEIIILRYFRHKTQSEVAKLLGLTQVGVSRREKKILLSMRAKLV